MAQSPMRLFKQAAEYIEADQLDKLPAHVRGIYTLLDKKGHRHFEVVYVGLAKVKVRSRLRKHLASERKGGTWTHFSVYEVHDNVTDAEIAEIEGIIRHIYRYDKRVNLHNEKRGFERLRRIRRNKLDQWQD